MRLKNILMISALAVALSAQTFADNLVIMHTNDVHGHIRPDRVQDRGGMVRAKAVVDSIRKAEKHTLLLDAGDDVQGYMYFSLFGGRVEYEMMNRMGYDVVTIGNHEFDNGMDSLKRNYDILKADVVCANYGFKGTVLEDRVKPYTIRTVDGKRFAIIGLGAQPEGLIIAANYAGMTYRKPIAVADSIAKSLKAKGKADYAIALSHIGYRGSLPDMECDSLMALRTEAIDLIVGGHSHTVIDPKTGNHQYIFKNKVGRNVLVTQTGNYASNLGKITINLDDLSQLPKSELIPIDARYDGRLDEATDEWLKGYDKAVEEIMAYRIAESTMDMPKGSDALRNWVADMMYEMAPAITSLPVDLAITNSGGIRRPLYKGDVTLGQVMSMLPFTNSLQVLEMDGATLLNCLDEIAAIGPQAVSRQLEFTIRNGKATGVKLNGKAVDPKRIYRVVTIDYVAAGNDNLVSFRKGKKVAESKQYLKYDAIDYLKRLDAEGGKVAAPVEARIRVAD